MPSEDKELIQECRQGNKGSFRLLVERYEKAGYALAYNMLYDYDLARDISQEAWIKVYTNIRKFDLNRKFYPWFAQIVNNLCIDYLRKHKIRTKPLEEFDAIKSDKPVDAADINERQEMVRRLLQKLPEKYREVLVLSDIESLPSKEIAGIIKCNDATVRWRIHEARQLFKKVWEEYERMQ
ncbi:MAG: sigma-70 family RNA polymerase sigma factor [Planctomycetes bacterium]|nr:sigma-70 family RNA polymerase sigma factor [Planctomycetota bacterium]